MIWKSTRLETITEVITKGTTPTTLGYDFAERGIPFLRVQNITGGNVNYENDTLFIDAKTHASLSRSQIQPGDILVSIAGTIGRAGVVPANAPPLNCNQAVAIIRPTQQVFRPFLRLWIESSAAQSQIRNSTVTGTISNLSLGQLGNLEIPLPPLAEQRRIAEVLDRAEALRTKRRAALAQLDALTQSLFLDLFGDPVANERKWPVRAVNDFVAGFESGKSIVADDEDDTMSPYRVLKVSAVTSLEFRPEQSKAMPPDYEPPKSHIVRAGDLLFSRANTAELIGATAYVSKTPPNLLLPDKLWRFVWHDEPKANPHFVRFLFQQPKFRREITQRASGTSGSMKNISQDKVLTIEVGLPPLAQQREFARRVTAVEKLKTAQRASLAELDALFATLQHRAFRGEL